MVTIPVSGLSFTPESGKREIAVALGFADSDNHPSYVFHYTEGDPASIRRSLYLISLEATPPVEGA